MYIEGEGGPPNPATAAYWYDKAAKQGSSMSAEALGALYLEGDGVDTDPVKAVALFEQAANQGEPNSIVLLGELYAEGLDGLPRNGKQASYWFQQGADRDLPAAQYGLATLHASGELIPRDLKQAEFWYLKAARRGHAKAQLELGLLYLNQPGSSAGLKGAQVWLTEASRQEETAARARNHLARLCRANPALNCQLSSAGPSLGALLPPAARRRL
jgi:TPR repeat protein